MNKHDQIIELETDWKNNSRWKGIKRPYSAKDVVQLRPSLQIEYTLARHGANKLWALLNSNKPVTGLGCLTGNQAVQAVQAGLQVIYCSGWQVAGDNNSSGRMYPDQSLYPVDSVPRLVETINNALKRTDEIHCLNDDHSIDWYAPIIADAEAGFGGNLNAFELMKHMIRAGASAVHFEDQLSSAKKCGHMGGKVLIPSSEAVNKLIAARLATDVKGVPTLIIARTDADAASLLTSDHDERDMVFLTGKRSSEGFYYVKSGIEQAISRGLTYAPYADVVWCETSKPNIAEAREFAQAIHEKYPGKLLCYNCSPSFNWKANLSEHDLRTFREQLFEMGYKYQFITLAGWHSLNLGMFEIARAYAKEGMYAYSQMQQREIAQEEHGFRATKHQSFVGTGYFDAVQNTIMQNQTSTTALDGSTEKDQF
ncbi:2-methylisocitrate lyase [Legionella quinlivanii]|uniref:Isocitrate lyase n=1 Tax=Legionella quinlivanii TaxID=45073 RepID=A0A0W0XPK1_9GAMM|nr:isocitrate lyase [Legionella quinlivanii]KTD46554.1 2-methylisocitrate lyase [Legionella quinlivanii]MCW8451543.1 isocitrate lyase [Legionella quinlivanii]SEG09440.1 isocitrate lyase [Legionella quinlivanii DSM 21216]STY10242.1 methylisocitrate lyase [Legionella quinlivanii]